MKGKPPRRDTRHERDTHTYSTTIDKKTLKSRQSDPTGITTWINS